MDIPARCLRFLAEFPFISAVLEGLSLHQERDLDRLPRPDRHGVSGPHPQRYGEPLRPPGCMTACANPASRNYLPLSADGSTWDKADAFRYSNAPTDFDYRVQRGHRGPFCPVQRGHLYRRISREALDSAARLAYTYRRNHHIEERSGAECQLPPLWPTRSKPGGLLRRMPTVLSRRIKQARHGAPYRKISGGQPLHHPLPMAAIEAFQMEGNKEVARGEI